MDAWYQRPIDPRAMAGGELGVDNVLRKGGQFEPFYVPREQMPQIEEVDYPDLLRHASENGVFVKLCQRNPHDLKLHQRVKFPAHFKSDPAIEAKPVLSSADSY